ncbi:tyrosine-type recombinase/integrase [Tateyamaria sp.]|uniref:tyrosine-type recombinase/integrase n=1 Tax=Tateyamaria sp. TaxID=1929288 RepID=UPI00329DD295
MAPRKLTASQIPTLEEGTHTDASGAVIRVLPSGKRSWSFMYRINRQRRRMSLGQYPQVSLADARAEVSAAKVSLAKGIDPQQGKDEIAASETVGQGLDLYRDLHLANLKSGKNVELVLRRLLEPHAKLPIIQVTEKDLVSILNKLRREKKSVALKRYKTNITGFFNWCHGVQHLIEVNPAANLSLTITEKKYKPRKRALTNDELASVMKAANGLAYPYREALLTLIYTGQRKSEVLGMRWSDLEQSTWTQSDNKAGREHKVHLADQLQDLYLHMPRHLSGLMFTTNGTSQVWFGTKLKEKLDLASGVVDWTFHDLRRTFGTRLAEMRASEDIIGRCLNHSPQSITGRTYIASDRRDEKIELWEMWANHLEEIQKETSTGPDAVPLRSA